MESLLHGLMLAFGLILPLGVQNIFVFTQGATQPNLLRAFPAFITASICDTFLILLSVFGLSLVIVQMEELRTVLMVAGIVFLLYMSVSVWRSTPMEVGEGTYLPVHKQILFACSVSFLNPQSMLDIVGVIGTSALKYTGTELVLFTIGCIVVSWVWFFGLMYAGSRIKSLGNPTKVMNVFNKSSAIFIFAMAVYLGIGLM